MYSLGASEEVLGRALRDFGPGRDRVVIATKVFNAMGDDPNQRGPLAEAHPPRDRGQPEAPGDRLRRPLPDPPVRPDTPVEETMEALDDLVREGKVLHLGASSMFAWQLAKMIHASRGARMDPVRHDAEPLQPPLPRGGARDGPPLRRPGRWASSRGARWRAGLLARGPEGNHGARQDGRLRAEPLRPGAASEADRAILGAVHRIAAERGVPAAQVALAWLCQKPGVVAPIVGASKPHHLEDAVAALSSSSAPRRSRPSSRRTPRVPWRAINDPAWREHGTGRSGGGILALGGSGRARHDRLCVRRRERERDTRPRRAGRAVRRGLQRGGRRHDGRRRAPIGSRPAGRPGLRHQAEGLADTCG
jgi:1-deoxyxylulose-5-phosphate synthase